MIVTCVINIFSKYSWFVLLKDKISIAITNACQKIVDESWHQLNKIWVHKGSQIYNGSMKSWLKDDDIEISSTQNEGKSVVAKRFLRILKNKIYKYMTSISKNIYIDKLYYIINQYNNTCHYNEA